MDMDSAPPPATPKRRYVKLFDFIIKPKSLFVRRQSSSADAVVQPDTGSAIKRLRRPGRKAAGDDERAPELSQIAISPDRLNLFKTHLSTFIDRQPSVTTQEIFDYMKQHDSTFNEDEIRLALANMQDENQIMLAGEIVIRI
jgi:hypothetical protein